MEAMEETAAEMEEEAIAAEAAVAAAPQLRLEIMRFH